MFWWLGWAACPMGPIQAGILSVHNSDGCRIGGYLCICEPIMPSRVPVIWLPHMTINQPPVSLTGHLEPCPVNPPKRRRS